MKRIVIMVFVELTMSLTAVGQHGGRVRATVLPRKNSEYEC